MNTIAIKILIEKYETGETSLSEERLLKQYFASGAIDPDLRHYAPLFAFFENEQHVVANDKLEGKILEKLEAQSTTPFYKTRTFWTWASGIAASLVLVFSLVFEMQQSRTKNQQAMTIQRQEEARQAYQQTKMALAYISEKYVQGTDPLNNIEKLEQSTRHLDELAKINSGFKTVNKQMKKMDKGVDQITKLSKFSIVVKP